jgi:DnaJ-class molecular chaperone
MATIECKRCCGTGKVGNFANVKGGVCFACNGTGRRVKMKRVMVQGFAAVFQGGALYRETEADAAELAKRMNGHVEPRKFKKMVPA